MQLNRLLKALKCDLRIDIYRVLEDKSREEIISFLDSIVDDGVSSDKCKQQAKVNLKNIPTFLIFFQ